MKFLIVNDFLVCGGAEKICLETKKILENKGNDVAFLSFETPEKFKRNYEIIKEKYNVENFFNIPATKNKLNKFIFNHILYLKIRKFLKSYNPDVIFMHNCFYSPITQISALKGYKIIKVVHDYGIVCPKTTCVIEGKKLCSGYSVKKCLKTCRYNDKKLFLAMKLYLLKVNSFLLKKYVTNFISPSESLNEYLIRFGYNSIVVNNPINIENFDKSLVDTNVKKYIYLGNVNYNKGILDFLKYFDDFSLDKNVELTIYGDFENKETEKTIKQKYLNNSKIKFMGFLNNKEVVKRIAESDFCVVPSIGTENYPTTILESMCMKTLVLGSNRSGISELLRNERGITFDIMDKSSVDKVLNESYNMNMNDYNRIVNNAYNYVKDNNSEEKYLDKLMKIISLNKYMKSHYTE